LLSCTFISLLGFSSGLDNQQCPACIKPRRYAPLFETISNMKVKYLFVILVLSLLNFGCQEQASKLNHYSKFTLSPTLIQRCIDSTIVLDSAINTKDFYVDLELLKKIDPISVTNYLNENKNIKFTNFDSLVKVKSHWLKKEFFQNDIICFEKVEKKGGDTIFIETTKRRAIDASFGTEIVFKKDGEKLNCIKSNISWIN
jgi:hypothetical protein